MGEVKYPIRLHGVLASPESKPGDMGVSHKNTYTCDYIDIYLLDEGSKIAWGQSKI